MNVKINLVWGGRIIFFQHRRGPKALEIFFWSYQSHFYIHYSSRMVIHVSLEYSLHYCTRWSISLWAADVLKPMFNILSVSGTWRWIILREKYVENKYYVLVYTFLARYGVTVKSRHGITRKPITVFIRSTISLKRRYFRIT